jgi:hypothetical protein
MNKMVWTLLTAAFVSWGICIAYPTRDIHFGWIGTLLGSVAGIIAMLSSYRTEETVHGRGGVIYKSESPVHFFMAHALVGLFLAALAWLGILGCMGRI